MSRISRSTGRVQRIDVDDGPSSVLVVGDHVWVTNRYSGTVSRIDARTNDVDDQRPPQCGQRGRRGRRGALGRVRAAPPAPTSTEAAPWSGRGPTLAPTVDPASAYFVFNQYCSGRPTTAWSPSVRQRTFLAGASSRTWRPTCRNPPTAGAPTSSRSGRGSGTRPARRSERPTSSGGCSEPCSRPRRTPSCSGRSSGPPSASTRASPGKACDLSRGVVADDTAGRLTIRLTEPDPELLEKLALLRLPGTGRYAAWRTRCGRHSRPPVPTP